MLPAVGLNISVPRRTRSYSSTRPNSMKSENEVGIRSNHFSGIDARSTNRGLKSLGANRGTRGLGRAGRVTDLGTSGPEELVSSLEADDCANLTGHSQSVGESQGRSRWHAGRCSGHFGDSTSNAKSGEVNNVDVEIVVLCPKTIC